MRAAALACALLVAPTVVRADPPPAVMLWAWERPEDLRFLPPTVGVASLDATVDITPGGPRVASRRQPLLLPDGRDRVAVVRVQSRPRGLPLTDAARAEVLRVVARAASRPGVRGVQIDYDAPVSQRSAYRALLAELRGLLGVGMWLSMTALASWCVGDRWLDEETLPVDEVVPMLFTMGRGGERLRAVVQAAGRFESPRCRGSLGLAVGEPAVTLRGVVRTWVFNPRAWTEATARPWWTGR